VQALRKVAILDRDGVINLYRAYVSRWEDFEFVAGAVDAMRALKKAGFALVVVTNQSGIAHGYYTDDQYQALTIAMKQALIEAGAAVDAVYRCPHRPAVAVVGLAVDCDCRKPALGMIYRAARELSLFLPDPILVGDKPSDIQAVRAAGVGRAYIVHSDKIESGPPGLAGADAASADLYSCAADLCGDSGRC
jgi:D-glycero-D-manno-heptose 1,7-bisphosphate phosphatase